MKVENLSKTSTVDALLKIEKGEYYTEIVQGLIKGEFPMATSNKIHVTILGLSAKLGYHLANLVKNE